MTEQTFGPYTEEETGKVIQAILDLNPRPRIITFRGDLGAGKTTLIKKLVPALGSNHEVSSPTFGLVNEYRGNNGLLICHTDWYRIRNIHELLDAGLQEYLHDDNCLMLVEWPEVGAALLEGEQALHIHILHEGDRRSYHFTERLS